MLKTPALTQLHIHLGKLYNLIFGTYFLGAQNMADTFEAYNRFLLSQIKAWNKNKIMKKEKPRPVITISREAGCGGELIAKMLADKLGLAVYGREIVKQIAEDVHMTEQMVAALDEKSRSQLDEWIAMANYYKPELSSSAYLTGLKKVVFSIAAHGNAIILGRGGNFLLPPENKLSLRLIAPLELRVKNIMATLKLTEKSAINHINKTENERQLFVKRYFNVDIKNPVLYNLVINTAAVKPKTILNIMKAMIFAQA